MLICHILNIQHNKSNVALHIFRNLKKGNLLRDANFNANDDEDEDENEYDDNEDD